MIQITSARLDSRHMWTSLVKCIHQSIISRKPVDGRLLVLDCLEAVRVAVSAVNHIKIHVKLGSYCCRHLYKCV